MSYDCRRCVVATRDKRCRMESKGEEREGEREGEGDGEKGRTVRLVAVTQASATMGLLCSVSRMALRSSYTTVICAEQRQEKPVRSGHYRVLWLALVPVVIATVRVPPPICPLRSPSVRCVREQSIVASRLHRSLIVPEGVPSMSFWKGGLYGRTVRADRLVAIARLSLFVSTPHTRRTSIFLGWRPRLSPLVR